MWFPHLFVIKLQVINFKRITSDNNASETWLSKKKIYETKIVSNWKIVRRIFGPAKERDGNGEFKKDELNNLIKNKNIINYIKTQRELVW
jgi:hypothetical protein